MTQPKGDNSLLFLSKVSHDFKMPVNRILAYVKLALREVKALNHEKLNDYLSQISTASLELLDLVRDMLEWSSLTEGESHYRAEFFELVPFLNSCWDEVHEDWKKKPIQFHLEAPPNSPPLFQDKHKLRRVILNLLTNAYKYTDQGNVTLKAVVKDDSLQVSVSDTGDGLSLEDLNRVFTPFVRLSPEKMSGTGLGLVLVKELVGFLGGNITVESKPGQGSLFQVKIPSCLDVVKIMGEPNV